MFLSGNLGFVSLDEVLRLLTRSSQMGSVDVRGEGIHGRIFVTKGGIGLATTSDDDGLRDHVAKSGLIDDGLLRDIEAGDAVMAPDAEKSGGPIVALLREMTVESIYQLGLHGEAFEVTEGEESRYASPKPFELESLIADSKQRLSDWADVSKIVTDLHGMMKFSRDLGERDEVSIDREAWRVLSEVGDGSSVNSIAYDLGTTEFWTARVAARLIEDELLTPQGEETAVDEPGAAPEVEPQSAAPEVEPAADEAPAVEPAADEAAAVEPAAAASDEPQWAAAAGEPAADVKHNESWWQEPTDEAGEPETPAAATEKDAPESPTFASSETSEVEEDTEAFLEKVFSELDSSESEEESEEKEEDAGYGLLRRRRMGALRDHTGDA